MRKLAAALAALLMFANTAGAISYPSALDGTGVFGTAIHGQPVQHTTINNLRDAVIALETKVGVNSSGVVSTLDYLLTNAASIDPGHKHTGASLQDIVADTITSGSLPDARLSTNVPLKNTANTFTMLQTFNGGASFSGGASFGGTVTAAHFSGQGDLLTNIPETAIANGSLLARVADNETISGTWTFSSAPSLDGANVTNIPEGNILNGALLARVGDNESITGTWSFVGNIAKIRNVDYLFPASNASGVLTNDGVGNLSWTPSPGVPVPGGGSGAVQFNTGGAFNGDTTNFFWDNTAKALGIGTNTPGQSVDVVGGNIRTNSQLISTVSTGTAPLSVNSTTKVTSLNADLLDGLTSADFEQVANKNAASGYAGLTAGTKLNLAQMQEVMGIVDLSDVTAKTGTGTTVVFDTSPTFTTSIITPLVTAAAGLSLTSGGGSNADITLTPDGTGVVHITSKLTVDGILDPTQVLLTGATKKIGATDSGTLFLAPFADAVRAVEVRDADGTTALVTFDTNNNRVGINKTSPQFNLDVGTNIHADNNITADGELITPNLHNSGDLLIDVNANHDITFTTTGTGNVKVSTHGTDYSNAAVCYLDASGTLGHCTSADASACTCVAN